MTKVREAATTVLLLVLAVTSILWLHNQYVHAQRCADAWALVGELRSYLRFADIVFFDDLSHNPLMQHIARTRAQSYGISLQDYKHIRAMLNELVYMLQSECGLEPPPPEQSEQSQ